MALKEKVQNGRGPEGLDVELIVFFTLIVLANTLFILGIARGIVPDGAYNLGRFIILGALLVGCVVSFRGPGAAIDLLRPLKVWRVHPGWYLLAPLWAPLQCILVLVVVAAFTGTNTFQFSDVLIRYPLLIVNVVFAAFVGEIVWVSYAINRMGKRMTLLEASLVVGVVWTLWWVPIVMFGEGVIPNLPYPALLMNMLGVAAMCGFVYYWTKSGLIVLLLQLGLNHSMLIFPVAPESDSATTYYLFSLLYFCTGIGMHLVFGPRPLFGSWRRHVTGQAA